MNIRTLSLMFALNPIACAGQPSDVTMSSGGHASLQAYPAAKISVKDSKTRITIYVEADGRHVVGLSESGGTLWRTEVIAYGQSCVAGSPVVRYLQPVDGKVSVTFCKHSYGEIDISNGKYRFLGQD